jgi:ABC-type transport system involved in multi-copper enzyme maturation permease subunit
MFNIFHAELLKLMRKKLIWLLYGLTSAITLLMTWGLFKGILLPSSHKVYLEGVADLSKSTGATVVYHLLTPILGIIAITLFASNLGREFSLKTWKNLIALYPYRFRALAAKFLALSSLIVSLTLLIFALSLLLSTSAAGYANLSVSKWFTSANIWHMANDLLRTTLGSLALGIFAFGITLIAKSSKWAITFVIGWFYIAEPLLDHYLPSIDKYSIYSNFNSITVDLKWGNGLGPLFVSSILLFAPALYGGWKFSQADITG